MRRGRAVVIGDGIVATTVGEVFSADQAAFAQLPEKVEGKHRWIAAASYVLDMPDRLIGDEDTMKLLDARHLMYLGIGCWDCERSWNEVGEQPCEGGSAAEPGDLLS